MGFHAQQAVEKAVKAVLLARGVEYRFSHDIAYLLELCASEGLTVPRELDDADRLSAFAVQLRYDAPPAAAADRRESLAWAKAAVAWASATIIA